MYSSTNARMVRKWAMDGILEIGCCILERPDPSRAATRSTSESEKLPPSGYFVSTTYHTYTNTDIVCTASSVDPYTAKKFSGSEAVGIDSCYTYKT